MVFLIHQVADYLQNATEDGFSLNFQKTSKSIKLVISALQLETQQCISVHQVRLNENFCWREVYKNPGVFLRGSHSVRTKAGNHNPRQEVGKAMSVQVPSWKENTH
jgi:hypothetical protein